MPRFKRTAPPANNKPTNNNSKKHTITVSGGNGGKLINGGNGNGKLTPKQARFIDEYLKDLNATQAAIRAGYSKRSANNIGPGHLLKPIIQHAIQKRRTELQDAAQIDQAGIVKRYLMLTDYHITDFFNDDGTMKPLSQIPKEKLYAIQGFKADEKVDVDNEKVMKTLIREFKLSNKRDVLDSLARHLGMFEKDNAQGGGGGNKFNFNGPVQINVRLVKEDE